MRLEVAAIHLFVEQFKASVVVADHEEPRLNVVIGQHIIFSVLFLLLSGVVRLAVLDVSSLVESNVQLFIAKLTDDLIGLDVYIDIIVAIYLKHVDIFFVYPKVGAVVELNDRRVGAVAVGGADGQLVRDNCDVGLQASDEGLSCFFNTDLASFNLVLSSFVKLDQL